MKVREGNAKVPIVPRAIQVVLASVSGVAFVALLVFVLVKPTTAEPSLAQTSTTPITIDGPAQELSTVETKKPVIITEEAPVVEAEPEVAVEQPKEEVAAPAEEKKPVVSTARELSYTVRAGDSYTAIVRAAVTRTMTANKATLSPAQRVAAETYIVQAAGAPAVDIAQTVTLSTEAIEAAIEKAQALTDDELAAWDIFASQVDFDEDDTPQPSVDDAAGADGVSDGGASDTGVSGGSAGGADSGPGSGN